MFTPVEPVQASASRSGLVPWALTPTPEDHWEQGFAWRPERCTAVRTFDPCGSPQDEVQTVTLTGGPTGGTFTLTYSGQTTAGIPFDASALTVQNALLALSNLAPGDVTVTPGGAMQWQVTFRSTLGDVAQLTGSGAGLTGGVAPAVNVVTTTPGYALYGELYGAGPSGTVYYRPMALEVFDECSARTAITLTEARIRRQVEGATSFAVARELWTGERSDANPYVTPEAAGQVNARLTGGAGVTELAGTFEPLHALGALEESARRDAVGMDVWIHMPITLVPLMEAGIVRDGTSLFTKTGARVIADAGYLGTSPEGAVDTDILWMYATGPVQVRLGAIQVSRVTDHRNNGVRLDGRRMFAATFDPCVLHGVAVETPATT